VERLDRKVALVSRLQLLFLSLTWLAGIYVNGFVAIPPGSSAQTVLLNPAVASHVVIASLSAATSVFLVALAWASGSRRLIGFTLLASLFVALAGDSGLNLVLGEGSESFQSMIMATAFVTALFLTFLSMIGFGSQDGWSASGERLAGRGPLNLCYIALVLFYSVFVTGIYVNLFVAGPVFSLPVNSQLLAFVQSEGAAAFIFHEALGGVLLATLVVLMVWLGAAGAKRLARNCAVPTLLVAYSAYVGSLNLTSPLAIGVSVWIPMLSSAGLMAAIVATMLITMKVRALI